MERKIWITKNWKLSACIMIWFEKPTWYPNKAQPQDKESGYWGDEKGKLSGHPFSYDALNNLFKVSFCKKNREGYIAKRILSIRKSKAGM